MDECCRMARNKERKRNESGRNGKSFELSAIRIKYKTRDMAVRLIARTALLRSKRDNGKHTVARRSKGTKEKGMREKERKR